MSITTTSRSASQPFEFNPNDTLSLLGPYVLRHILSQLPPKAILEMEKVSRFFSQFVRDQILYSEIVAKFPGGNSPGELSCQGMVERKKIAAFIYHVFRCCTPALLDRIDFAYTGSLHGVLNGWMLSNPQKKVRAGIMADCRQRRPFLAFSVFDRFSHVENYALLVEDSGDEFPAAKRDYLLRLLLGMRCGTWRDHSEGSRSYKKVSRVRLCNPQFPQVQGRMISTYLNFSFYWNR
jgi:hypothetical protein